MTCRKCLKRIFLAKEACGPSFCVYRSLVFKRLADFCVFAKRDLVYLQLMTAWQGVVWVLCNRKNAIGFGNLFLLDEKKKKEQQMFVS